MADTEDKPQAEKPKRPDKAEQAARPEKGDKGQQAQQGKGQKGQKAEKGDKADAAAKPKAKKPEEKVTPRLKTLFEEQVRKKLSDEFKYTNRMQVPVIEKIVINMGIGE